MTRYFVHVRDKSAVRVYSWSRDACDWLTHDMIAEVLRLGYVECGWWRYQWYKWWNAR